MSRKPVVDEDAEPAFTLLAKVDPAQADIEFASAKKFLDLAQAFGLTVKIDATLVAVADEFYARSNKTQAGELKKPGSNVECIFLTLITPEEDFAATVFWRGKVLQNGAIGGPRSGHRPEKVFGKSGQTKMIEEITQCLT